MAVRTEKVAAAEAHDGEDDQQSAKDKAQARRAQVRKAQIQHRQRKANYIKQLELDLVRIRDMISQTERETVTLRGENEAIRARLRSAGVGSPSQTAPAAPQQHQPPTLAPVQPVDPMLQAYDHVNFAPPSATNELFSDINVDEMTVTLAMDDVLGTPCYHISSSSSGGSVQSIASPTASEESGQMTPLTPEQETMAINFILS
jgi:hypothetical protein